MLKLLKLFIILAGTAAFLFAESALTEPFLLSEHGSGRATAYQKNNKIVTHGDKTHVTWQDTIVDTFWTKIRTFDRATNEWSPTYRIGEAYNNHGLPALTIDENGYLHVVYYAHHHPVRYRKSLRPNDASEWGPIEKFGQDLTYPSLFIRPDGTLVMTARKSYGTSGENRPWEIEMWTKNPGESWEKAGPIVRSRFGNYSLFRESFAWNPDHQTLHFAAAMMETPPEAVESEPNALFQRRQTSIVYMRSTDGGISWERKNGTPIELPATIENMDRIATAEGDESQLLSGAQLAVSLEGDPYIPWSLQIQDYSQGFISFPDRLGGSRYLRVREGEWRHVNLNQFLPEPWRDHDLIMYGGAAFGSTGELTIVATILDIDYTDDDFTYGNARAEVVRFRSKDGGYTFEAEIFEPTDPSIPGWLPAIETPTGFNRIPERPGVIYTRGPRGETNHDILSNEVWWKP